MEEEKGKLKCEHHDVEVIREITQAMMLSLACACKEKTYGSIFSSPISPAEGLKKEMVEFLERKCETNELDSGRSSLASPFSMVRYLLDEFVGSKKSFLNKVSSKGPKEEGVEELVGQLERSGIWPFAEREAIARDLLHALYPKGSYHCEARFDSEEALSEHMGKCPIRPVSCPNGQCKALVSASRLAAHDAKCPSKPLPCEQGCDGLIGRADMGRHCTSDCPMKRIDCPFCHVGCTAVLPQHLVNKHCSENTNAHLLQMLQSFQRQEVSLTKLSQRLSKAEKEFWNESETIVEIVRPINTMLRLVNSDLPCLGKVYEGMDRMIESIESSGIPIDRVEQLREICIFRWNQIHSPLACAAYVLDPEFQGRRQEWDKEVMTSWDKVLDKKVPVELHRKSFSVTQKAEADDTNAHMVMFQEQEAKIKALEGEAGKLRKSLAPTPSREVLQLQRDMQNLQSQVEALRSNP